MGDGEDVSGERTEPVVAARRPVALAVTAQVDRDGFATEVFRPKIEWGDAPCVIEIDPLSPELLLEVSVPDARRTDARVRLPIRAEARSWTLDDSPRAVERWDREIAERRKALEALDPQKNTTAAERLQSELEWLEQLRNGIAPVLEPADDGEEAR